MPVDLGKSLAAVAVCGCGHDGRLGLGNFDSTGEIKLIGDFLPNGGKKTPDVQSAPCGEVLRIHCGGYHTIVLTTRGVYGWGMHDCGQLGLGWRCGPAAENAFFSRPTRLEFFDAMGWNSKEKENSEEGAGTGAQEHILQVACGALHSMVLTNRALYACGRNEFGQLGLGHDEENVSGWTQVCSHRSSNFSAYCDEGVLDNNMSLILPFGRDSSIIQGVITDVSCGTHHTLLAWRDVVIVRHDDNGGMNETSNVSSTQRMRHDRDKSPRRYFYYPTLLMAAGKGDYGELGYDPDLYAALRSRDKHVQGTLWREATARQEQLHMNDSQHKLGELNAQESTCLDPTLIPNKISNKNPCAGWLRKQKRRQRRQEFYSTNFRAVNFELLERCGVALQTERFLQNDMSISDNALKEGNLSNCLESMDMPSDLLEVVQLQAMHLHSSVTLRKRVISTEAGSYITDTHHCDFEDMQTYHWGCYFCGEIEGIETSVPRLLDGKAGTTIHAGSEIMFRHRLEDSMGPPCTVEKCESLGDSPPQGQLNALEEVFVLGQGVLGLGSDDTLQRIWAPIPGTAHLAAKISGRTHFLMLLRGCGLTLGATDSCNDCILGFGDNMNGQIGWAYDHQNAKGNSQNSYSGSGVGEDNVEVLSPRHVLKVGDLLLAVPSTSPKQPKEDHLPSGRENVNQCLCVDSEPYGWIVDQIIDVGAGARHSVFFLYVHLEKRSRSIEKG
ncbi:unnamed protein product [Phytomonas sp. Hart1]|nr:unnamed protein product [Phytomonas sp. Hart1]|eukprot:CCW67690.1 unnamed protein product [Phytomonas sp. isolate Hart1]